MSILQAIISILLITVILVQVKGAGIGSSFGNSAAFTRTRRGAEKALFQSTIVLAVLFIVLSIANVLFF